VDMETVRATLEHLGFHDISDEMLAAYVEKLLAQHDCIGVEEKQLHIPRDEERDEHLASPQQCNPTLSYPTDQNHSIEPYSTPPRPQNHFEEEEEEVYSSPNSQVLPAREVKYPEEKAQEVQPYSEKLDSCRDLIQEAREMLHRRDLIDIDLERRRRGRLQNRNFQSWREMKDFSSDSSPESTLHTYEAELDYEEEYIPKIGYRLSSKEIRQQQRKNRRKRTMGFRSTDPVALAQKYREGWKRHGIR